MRTAKPKKPAPKPKAESVAAKLPKLRRDKKYKPRGRPFVKGKPRHPNAGRRKGTPNKVNQNMVAAILEVFRLVGGEEAYAQWVQSSRQAKMAFFAGVLTKLIPQQITGAGFGPLQLEHAQRDALSDKIVAAVEHAASRGNGEDHEESATTVPRFTH